MATGGLPPGGMDLSHIPSAPPPPGIVSNFVDPPTRAATVVVASAVVLTLSTIFVILRCYTRFFLVRIYGIGDYLLIAGYGFAMANNILPIVDTTRGFGRHDWDVPLSSLFPHIAKSIWWQIKLYAVAQGLVKLSILSLYHQLNPFRAYRAYVWALIALVISTSVAGLLWSIFTCVPISNVWSFEAAMANKCPLTPAFIIYTGAVNIATDLAILVLPMVIVRNITMARKKKIGVAIVLVSGSLASLISIVRVVVSIRSVKNTDRSWNNISLVIWSTSELQAMVICACLPTLRPLVRRYLPPCMGGTTPENSANSHADPELGGIELNNQNKNKNKTPKELHSDSTTTSWVMERISKNKDGGAVRDTASEEEHILQQKTPALSERDITTAGRGHSAGTDVGQAV